VSTVRHSLFGNEATVITDNGGASVFMSRGSFTALPLTRGIGMEIIFVHLGMSTMDPMRLWNPHLRDHSRSHTPGCSRKGQTNNAPSVLIN
jgi:hypothetical protein